MFNQLLNDPLTFLQTALYRVPALLITLCCHEWAHAYIAYRCGDPTARNLGRLTLDPRKHLDPVGTVLMIFAGFGWAKPVPVNPWNYRHRIADDVKVSLAGIATNLLLYLLCTTIAIALNGFLWSSEAFRSIPFRSFFSLSGRNVLLAYGYNPESYLVQRAWLIPVMGFISILAQMNLMVAIFNLLPIPPLDGYHVFNDLLLGGRMHLSPQAAQMGIMVIMILSFTTNILSTVMSFLANNIQGGVLWLFQRMIGA